jgi:hypothetical protein
MIASVSPTLLASHATEGDMQDEGGSLSHGIIVMCQSAVLGREVPVRLVLFHLAVAQLSQDLFVIA